MITAHPYPPELLLSFVTVAQSRSFSEAGRRLQLGQPTISQHINRLEALTGRRLFERTTHSVKLTEDGQAMLGFAQNILEVQERAQRFFAGSRMRERLRFGASEDFAFSRLPTILKDFVHLYPEVDLEITIALSGALNDMLKAGELDLALTKRFLDEEGGEFVVREKLVWVGAEKNNFPSQSPLPLVMFPSPSVTRTAAIHALDQAGIPWRIVCTATGLAGLRAATLAGFGLMVQPASLVPPGLTALPTHDQLPPLKDIEFVITGTNRFLRGKVAELAKIVKQGYCSHHSDSSF